MSSTTLKVNGAAHEVDAEPTTPLLYILRNDLGLQGPHFGCGLGQCGACTVIIKGAAVRSCITPVSSVKDEVTTLEGLAPAGKLHPLQQAWIEEQVPQCGFCQNGQILTAKVLLDKTPHPTDAQIRDGMNRTLCRCMTYYRVQAAIRRASKSMAEARPATREHAHDLAGARGFSAGPLSCGIASSGPCASTEHAHDLASGPCASTEHAHDLASGPCASKAVVA